MLRGKAKLAQKLVEALWDELENGVGITQAETGQYTVTGFTLLTQCNSQNINWQAETGTVSACLSLQAGGEEVGAPVGPTTTHLHLAKNEDLGGFERWQSVQVWKRVDSGEQQVLPEMEDQVTGNEGTAQIILDALLVPPLGNVVPAPIPYRLQPYVRHGTLGAFSESTVVGHDVRPAPVRTPLFGVPAKVKVASVTRTGDAGPLRPIRNGVHLEFPEPAGGKEKKNETARALGQAVGAFMDVTSESKEVIDILYESLPKYVKIKSGAGGNPFLRAQAIFNNMGKLNLSEAIPDLIWNHFSDKVTGRAFGAVSKSATRQQEAGQDLGNRLRQTGAVQKTFGGP